MKQSAELNHHPGHISLTSKNPSLSQHRQLPCTETRQGHRYLPVYLNSAVRFDFLNCIPMPLGPLDTLVKLFSESRRCHIHLNQPSEQLDPRSLDRFHNLSISSNSSSSTQRILSQEIHSTLTDTISDSAPKPQHHVFSEAPIQASQQTYRYIRRSQEEVRCASGISTKYAIPTPSAVCRPHRKAVH